MIALVVCARRRAGLSHAEFSRYWREEHAPLLLGCSDFTRHLISYVQYHPVDNESPVATMFGVSGDYDGVAVLTFASEAALTAAFAEPAYIAEVQPDEARLVDLEGCLSFLTTPAVIKAESFGG